LGGCEGGWDGIRGGACRGALRLGIIVVGRLSLGEGRGAAVVAQVDKRRYEL